MDEFDLKILGELQKNAGISQRELGERVGLSGNACWHRVKGLKERGVYQGETARVDRSKLNLGLAAFMLVRAPNHSKAWYDSLKSVIEVIPDIVSFYRIGGNYDYMMTINTRDMQTFDQVYQRLTEKLEFSNVCTYFCMETIHEARPMPLDYVND